MINKKAGGCTRAEVQQAGLAVSNQRDAQELARIAGPGECVAETGNAKRLCID